MAKINTKPPAELSPKELAYQVKLSNMFVRSSKQLSVFETRIIVLALAKINFEEEVSESQEIWLTLEDVKQMGGNSNNSYALIKKAANEAYERSIELTDFDDKPGWKKKFRIFQSCTFDEKKQMIGLRFSYDFLQHVSILRNFILFLPRELKGFSSSYSSSLYLRLMIQMKDKATGLPKNKWTETIKIDDLRWALGCEEGTYPLLMNFKRRVLDLSTKEINESPHTRFKISYENDNKTKIGRKVTALKFHMESKKGDAPESDFDYLFFGAGKPEKISRKKLVLTEAQLDMVSDWLSGNNGSRKMENSGLTISQFYEFLRKNRLVPLNLDVNNPSVYKRWLIEKLSNPDFVEAISPFLKKLGFR